MADRANIAKPTEAMIEAGLAAWPPFLPPVNKDELAAIYTAMRSSAPQEPVADDDALIDELRELKKGWVTSKSFSKFIDRVIDRLQAKAPETDCG